MVIDYLEKKYVHSKVFDIFIDHTIREGERQKDKDIWVQRLKRLDDFCKEKNYDMSFFGKRGIMTGVTSSKLAESRINAVMKWFSNNGHLHEWLSYKKSNPLNGD